MTTSPLPDERPPTLLEGVLQHQRATTLALLVVVPAACWIWIVVLARDMYGPMTGASAWMMTPAWEARHLLLLWGMWTAMMTGMMLPSAAPFVLIYSLVARRSSASTARPSTYALAAGYLTVWTFFSLGATALQSLLTTLRVLSPMMEVTGRGVAAAFLVLAGLYQFTPLKHACLRMCRSPFFFLMSGWRPGAPAAFLMGLTHGTYCFGCCWALMLLLFAGGVMNLIVIVALTALVAFEKLTAPGARSTQVTGILLIAAAIWVLLR